MLDGGIIERATSPYVNPLRIVRTNNGEVRICLDARVLNSFVEDDHECPPIIEQLMQKFYRCKYFSKIDLTAGYWQIPLHKNSRPYTAFIFGTSMYQFTRVPFGLKTAGCAFIRALSIANECNITVDEFPIELNDVKHEYDDEIIIANNINNNISTYIDDTAIATKSFKNHIKILNILFAKLLYNNFTIRLDKCNFLKEQILFLGFSMLIDGIKPDPSRIKIIEEFEAPKNQTQLQQFLGVCNYYRRFVLMHIIL